MRTGPPSIARLFVACAPSDLKYAELIVAKARHDKLPIIFDSFGEGRSTDATWQLECRRRIRACRALVLLLSPRTRASPRAVWQVQCARALNVPVVAISVAFGGDVDPLCDIELDGQSLVGWKWKAITATLIRLATTGSEVQDHPAAVAASACVQEAAAPRTSPNPTGIVA